MILTLAVIAGLLAGSIRAGLHQKVIQPPNFSHAWILFASLLPQIIVFQLPRIGQVIPLFWAKGILLGSFVGLLLFVWCNRKLAGLKILGLGALLNLFVILSNGGLMPISPENASYVHPETAPETWALGERLGIGKDIVLAQSEIRFEILSDRFRLPFWMPYRAAYSLGDVFIAIGAFSLLWTAGKYSPPSNTVYHNSLTPWQDASQRISNKEQDA